MVSKVVHSSKKQDHRTPPDLFRALDEEFSFTLDPAASDDNHLCAQYFTESDNGLLQSWANRRVFLNPPYSRTDTGLWLAKTYRETMVDHRCPIAVLLVPSRTERPWWHRYVMKAYEVRFITGRLKFWLPDGSGPAQWEAPFPSAIIVFRADDCGLETHYRSWTWAERQS